MQVPDLKASQAKQIFFSALTAAAGASCAMARVMGMFPAY